jgi:hypothetical protein
MAKTTTSPLSPRRRKNARAATLVVTGVISYPALNIIRKKRVIVNEISARIAKKMLKFQHFKSYAGCIGQFGRILEKKVRPETRAEPYTAIGNGKSRGTRRGKPRSVYRYCRFIDSVKRCSIAATSARVALPLGLNSFTPTPLMISPQYRLCTDCFA